MYKINEADKANIREWMAKYCRGYRAARVRKDIIPFVLTGRPFVSKDAKDRYFRQIASELIHEGHVASAGDGYWYIPEHTMDRREVEAVIACHQERKSKALSLIADCDKIIAEFLARKCGQAEFDLTTGKK